jgi:photosystem II stability/assembly factor-like uncharacterized protein
VLRHRVILAVCVAALTASIALAAPPFEASAYAPLKWRCIGPFRGGRTVGATGIPGKPNEFLIGVNNGGVWKTTDFGHTWVPIFDDQPTGSIGALAVAPSNPEVIYVGCGEGLQRPDLSTGDGVYKSIDGGKTWKHVGLRDGQQIGAVIVDPKNPDRVFVAVLGHPYGPNAERGVFRSTNGGQTWDKVLYKDPDTGAIALAFDPTNPQTIYADMWAGRQGPWENAAWQGPNSGLFKSTDGGNSWRQLTKGLPTADEGLGRIGFCISASDPQRIYATVDARQGGGIYRSDDAGESWRRVASEQRLWGRGSDFAEIKVDPKNPDVVYVANTGLYRSTDGARTWTCIRGAPGGDDYHTVWINPDNPQVILVASDQGATITVNGGQTWSSWYNQPTAQFYHVSTDNRFPYWVYGGQQESGSAGVSSRGRDGQITFRDWHPVGVEEYGYAAVDPLNPDFIYGGKITKFDRRTGQVQDISPGGMRGGRGGAYRFLRTAPVLFSPVDPHILYFAGNVLFKTTNGGHSWDVISPDLTREKPEAPSGSVFENPGRRGVIYTVAPSYKDVNTIWAGTDDGLIHVTKDGGKTWTDVTPPGMTAWSKVSIIDAGRHDGATAYAAINRLRLDDLKPHIFRTHDYGKTWKEIVAGLPADPVNAVREDPERPGLLFAGTERMVHVSFNDGDDWQPLRQNMPCTSIRDLVVHQDDLVVGTHGRSFWILDDITPLRQLTKSIAESDAFLFKPQVAYRVRWNVNTDTPLPPEEPAGKNPPDGAIIDYSLKKDADGPVVLEILDDRGKLVRRYSSDDKPERIDPRTLTVAAEWARPPQVLSAKAGAHRFVWDLHYAPPDGPKQIPMTAIYHDTAPEPHGPWVRPGTYTVWLTAGGLSYTQPLTVKMDPRVPTPAEGLAQQFTLSMQCYDGMRDARVAQGEIRKLRAQITDRRAKAGEGPVADALTVLDRKVAALEGPEFGGGRRGGRGGRGGQTGGESLGRAAGELGPLLRVLQGADMTPTTQEVAAVTAARKTLDEPLKRWREIKENDVKSVNEQLKKAELGELRVE